MDLDYVTWSALEGPKKKKKKNKLFRLKAKEYESTLGKQVREEAGDMVELVNQDIVALVGYRPWCLETTDIKKN